MMKCFLKIVDAIRKTVESIASSRGEISVLSVEVEDTGIYDDLTEILLDVGGPKLIATVA